MSARENVDPIAMPLENYQQTVIGPAFTVKYVTCGSPAGTVGDFIDDVEEGDIVVLDNDARVDCTVWGDIMAGLMSREWDLAFFGPTPERNNVLNFTEPLLVIEHGYLVPPGSPISTIDAVDRPEIRVGAPQGGSVNAFLKRALKNATVVASPSVPAGLEMLKSGKVDAFAANKANLYGLSDEMPGSRVLNGRIGVDEVAIAIPKARESGMAYVRKYAEDVRAEGLVKAAIQRAGLRGTADE